MNRAQHHSNAAYSLKLKLEVAGCTLTVSCPYVMQWLNRLENHHHHLEGLNLFTIQKSLLYGSTVKNLCTMVLQQQIDDAWTLRDLTKHTLSLSILSLPLVWSIGHSHHRLSQSIYLPTPRLWRATRLIYRRCKSSIITPTLLR